MTKSKLTMLASLACSALLLASVLTWHTAEAAAYTITPDNMQGWFFALDSGAAGTGQMAIGPGTPPAGSGSAQLTVANAATGSILTSFVYTGTPLANITALSYSTYRTSSAVAAQLPSLQLNVNYSPVITSWQGRLVYEPYLQLAPVPAPATGVWQTWDAINGGNGRWYATGAPGNATCTMASPCTWNQVLSNFPDIRLNNNFGGVVFKAGSGWASFNGNVDNLSMTVSGVTDTYNFEPLLRVHNITQSTSYPTIQLAVNAANPNDVLEADAGIFNENVTINKALTLRGAGAGSDPAQHTIIDGTALAGRGIFLTTNTTGVTIEDLRVQRFTGANGAGIYANAGNNNFIVRDTHVITNGVAGNATGGIYMNGPVDNVLIDTVLAQNNQTRGIVIWNGFKTNITITNSTIRNNNCCGIELQDGTSSGVTITNNTIENNADSGLSVLGLRGGAGASLIANNTISSNGRFGMEIKNPMGTGLDSGDGSIVIENNTLSFNATVGMNNRDHGGILIMRRDFTPGNPSGYPDVPTGVVIRQNSVTGYTHLNQVNAPTESEGFGIVIEGTNHTVISNTLTSNNIGVQEQGGLHPVSNYVPNNAGSGSQNAGDSAAYFGRGNAPVACGNTIAGNTFATNGQDVRQSIAATSMGMVTNTATGEIFCSIQAAIDDTDTLPGHTIVVSAGEYPESIAITKAGLQVLGPNAGIDPNEGGRVAEAILRPTALTPTTVEVYNVYIAAGGVLFDGFTVDGDNLDVTTGTDVNGANIDGQYLVYAVNTNANGSITVTHNIVRNGLVNGFVGYTGGAAVSSANVVANNHFDNINNGVSDGRALAPRWNYYANLMDNVVTRSVIGIYNDNAHQASAQPTVVWSGNHISAERSPIWYNLAYGTATAVSILDNHLTAEDSAFARWDGMWLTSLGGSLDPIISGNFITATLTSVPSNGYHLWSDGTTAPGGIKITGGAVVDTDYGVWINNWDGYPTTGGSNAGPSTATISDVLIDNATLAAVYAKDNPLEPDGDFVRITLHNVTLSNAPIAVLVEGPQAIATVRGSAVDNVATVFDLTDGTLLAYANNITDFTTGVDSTTPTALNARHNWWGAIDPTGVNNSDAVDYRLGAAVDTWGEGALGNAALTSAGGTGTGIIVSHGRGVANVPFGKGSSPSADEMCADYYDFFVINANGDWTVSVPVDNTAACADTLANGNLYHMVLSGTMPDTTCTSEACWTTPAGVTAVGQNLNVTLDAAQFLLGTPFAAGENTPDHIPPVANVELGADQAQAGVPSEVLTYTVSITNTGNTTGTMLLSLSNEWAVSYPASVADLGGGASTTFDVAITVPANALAGEMDTAVLTATVQGEPNNYDTVTLTSTAEAVYGVSASGTGLLIGLPSVTVTHTVTITNEGNASDTFDVELGTAVWNTVLGQATIALAAGATGTVDVTVDIPADALFGDNDSVVVDVTSQGDDTQTADVTLATEAGVFYAVSVSGTGTLGGLPGATVTHTVTITNDGNTSDTFDVALGTAAWNTVLGQGTITLAAGASGIVAVTVDVPVDAISGDNDTVVATATSQGDDTQTADTTLTTQAGAVYAVSVSGTGTLTGEVGTIVTHTVTITNNGNASDTFSVSAGTAAWTTTLGQTSVTLAAGETATVQVVVSIPATADDGEMDSVVISAASQGDGTQTAAVTLTTVAQVTEVEPPMPTIYLPLIMRP